MFVYVLNQHGDPLMPCSPRKARILLKQQKAKVVKRTPVYDSTALWEQRVQTEVSLGVVKKKKNGCRNQTYWTVCHHRKTSIV